jgi:hypothetical protein
VSRTLRIERADPAALLEHPTVAALAGFVTGGHPTDDAKLGTVADRMSRRRQARTRRGTG